jgi:hypothetical protein
LLLLFNSAYKDKMAAALIHAAPKAAFVADFSLGLEFDSGDFGHFEEIEDTHSSIHTNNRSYARDVWLNRLNIPENRPRTQVASVLNAIRIVNPSVSVKVENLCGANVTVAGNNSKYFDITNASSMSISSCINGIRIVQLSSGLFRAEYQILFCCGSMSYSKWKYLEEFRELAKMVKYMHDHSGTHSKVKTHGGLYAHSVREWDTVEKNVRHWFGHLEIAYLVDMSCRLGNFIQELLLESLNPRLLLLFVKNEDFIVE